MPNDADDAEDTDADEAFAVEFDALQPTQYCLSTAKLRGVMDWFDFEDPGYEPVEVARAPPGSAVEADVLLVDGHSRAFCALLAGEQSVRAVDVTETVDIDVYVTCRDWCVERDVESVQDLVGEVWSAERYGDEWLARCADAFGGE